MAQLEKKPTKTIEQYQHNIKLLKYYLKKQTKANQNLKYQLSKASHKTSKNKQQPNNKNKTLENTVKAICNKLKNMGLVLGDVFRMADMNYQGEVTKEQFMKVIQKLKCEIDEQMSNQLFYAIDTSLNGIIEQDEYEQFVIAYGGGDGHLARKYQSKALLKLSIIFKKSHLNPTTFVSKMKDPIKSQDFTKQMKRIGLNNNEIILLIKMFDPSEKGQIKHQLFIKQMTNIMEKDQKEAQNKQKQNDIKMLCIKIRDNKINPIIIFEQADVDGVQGISPIELENALKKILPNQTHFQIKKWVSLINANNDQIVTKQQFINSIRSFYTIEQLNKLQNDESHRSKPKKILPKQEIPIQKIMLQLRNKIEISGMTNKQFFNMININKDKVIDKKELMDGLKHAGMDITFVGKVMSVFDSDDSNEITLNQWLHILGQDVQMSDVQEPPPSKLNKQNQNVKKDNKKQTKPSNLANQSVSKQQNKKSVDSAKVSPSKQQKVIPKKDQKSISKLKQSSKPIKQSKKPVKQTKKQAKKQTKKQTKIDNKPSKIIKTQSKTFAEDQIDKQQQKLENKSIQQQVQNHQQYNNNLQNIEKQIAIYYQKNKTSLLAEFQKNDKKNMGFVNQNIFEAIIKKIKKDINQNQISELFNKIATQDKVVMYYDWLSQISQQYPIPQQVTQPKNKTNSNKNNKQDIPSLLVQKALQIAKPEKKRGDSNIDFNKLLLLKLQENNLNNQGYKLSDYIDSKQQLALMKKKYIPTLQSLKKNKKIFVDEQFSASINSLTKIPSKSQIPNVTMLKWRHYKDLFKNAQLFQGGVDPNDILQGSLGNCYFLCSLSCLAEYTNLIERLFEYYDIENGYFLVWLCIDGQWKLIQLDGMVPTDPTGKNLVFSKTNSQQLWVILLEKAYAKAYGDYQKIIGGQAYEAIKDLSGGPGKSFSHKDVKLEQIWKKLFIANEKKFLMSCGTELKQDKIKHIDGHSQAISQQGIVLGHAYSILDTVQINGQKIIKLRNPWGKVEWNGQWSDSSKKWTPEIKKKLNYTCNENDGTFWMPFNIFYQEYNTTAINYIRPTYYYMSQQKKNVKSMLVKIKPKSFEQGYFMVSQRDHRHQGLPVNTPYNLLHLISFTLVDGKVSRKISDAKYLYQRQGCVQFENIQQNQQAVFMINIDKSTDVRVGYYGNKVIEFQTTSDSLPYMEGLAILEVNSEDARQQAEKFRYWCTSVGDIGFLCIKNISKQIFSISITMSNLTNIKLIPPQGLKTRLSIRPNQTKSVRGRIIDEKKNFNFGQFGISFQE